MLNQQWYHSLGVGIPLVTSVILFEFIDGTTNLFNTGLTPNLVLGFGCLFIAWAIYKNRI